MLGICLCMIAVLWFWYDWTVGAKQDRLKDLNNLAKPIVYKTGCSWKEARDFLKSKGY